jgi:hypothetical protein
VLFASYKEQEMQGVEHIYSNMPMFVQVDGLQNPTQTIDMLVPLLLTIAAVALVGCAFTALLVLFESKFRYYRSTARSRK